MYTEYVDAAMRMVMKLRSPDGVEMYYFRGRGFCPARAHNHFCEQALEWGADVIIIVGPDQVHPPDMLEKLIAHRGAGRLLVSAIVPFRGYVAEAGMERPFQPVAWQTRNNKPVVVNPKKGNLQVIDAIGTGVLMFPAAALKLVSRPWFEEKIVDADTYTRSADQDVRFVKRLIKATHEKLYLDFTIKVEHLNVFPIDDSFQHRFGDWKGRLTHDR